jgi:hypothetical protein
MKTCTKCQTILPLSDFYPNSAQCKTCVKAAVRQRIEEKKKDPLWMEKERERCREKQQRYREEGKAVTHRGPKKTATVRRYRAKYPDKYKAHAASKNIPKQPCEVCGNPKAQKHHEDYSKPLEVKWLCVKHHAAHHVEQRRKQLHP